MTLQLCQVDSIQVVTRWGGNIKKLGFGHSSWGGETQRFKGEKKEMVWESALLVQASENHLGTDAYQVPRDPEAPLILTYLTFLLSKINYFLPQLGLGVNAEVRDKIPIE